MNLWMICLFCVITGYRVDTLRTGLPQETQGLLALHGQLFLDLGNGYLESIDGEVLTLESSNLPLEIHSDGLRVYARFADHLVQFSQSGHPLQTLFQDIFRSFAIQDGTALYALTWDGTDVLRWDFTGPEDLNLRLSEPAQRIFAVAPDGFALVFQNQTVLYDPYGFPLDSLSFRVTYLTRISMDLVFLRDTLWITPRDTFVTHPVVAATTWQDAVYWLTTDGILMTLHQTR